MKDNTNNNLVVQYLKQINSAGANEDGSFTRSPFSDEYFQAAEVVQKIMKSLGMRTEYDAAGNIHGILPGAEPGLGAIIMGSHLDTVPHGGMYDGAYGVACALETVRRLQERQQPITHTIEVYGFNGEESGPLGGTFGSRVITGVIDLNAKNINRTLKDFGRTADEMKSCIRDFSHARCYLEAHIEQGPVLYERHIRVGVVNGIVGIRRYLVTASGQNNHAGTTTMSSRKDSLLAMAKLMVQANEACKELDQALVLTFGTIENEPNATAVIPGKTSCTFEVRHMKDNLCTTMYQIVREIANSIPDARFDFRELVDDKDSVLCDPTIMAYMEDAAEKRELSYMVLHSGAGHDANPMAHRIPMAMLFVPSKDGRSHCKEEWSSDESLKDGADVMYDTVCRILTEDCTSD